MKDSKILREISLMLSVTQADIPKTLAKFKRDIEEMGKELSQ